MINKFLYIKENCPDCKGKGFKFSDKRAFKGEEEEDAVQCHCLKKAMMYQRLDEANVPEDFWDFTLDDFRETTEDKIDIKENIQKAISQLDKWRLQGGGIFLYGPKGTGKTLLATQILKAALRSKYSIYYDFFPIIFSEFQKAGYKADEVKERYTKLIKNTDFMVFDELGKESEYFKADPSISKRFIEINILKKRAKKPTIFISNFDNGIDDIAKNYGQYVASMMRHNYKFIKIDDIDFREKKS